MREKEGFKVLRFQGFKVSKVQGVKVIVLEIAVILASILLIAQEIRSEVSVVTEEYVPKVIIEAKWGTNEGEFGRLFEAFGEPYPGVIEPSSLAVDSKGNIYILDIPNNRIQKFNKEGEYIRSIKVPSWKGYTYYGQLSDMIYTVPSEGYGINIAIDSEDNLYYYWIKNRYILRNEADKNKDGRIDYRDGEENSFGNPDATGEVWVFKDDKLVSRVQGFKVSSGQSVEVKDEDGKVIGHIVSDYSGGTRFEPEKDYVVEKQKIDKNKEKVIIKFKDGRKMEKVVKAHRPLKELKSTRGKKYFGGKEEFSTVARVLSKREEIYISSEIYNADISATEVVTWIYDFQGNLKSILKGDPYTDNDGKKYHIKINPTEIQIIKYERRPIKK